MKNELQHPDLNTLSTLHAKHQKELEQILLDGASWEEVKEKQQLVTELSILIHKQNEQNSAKKETT